MRAFTMIFFSITILSITGFAADSDLNIRVDAIKNRQSVYTSATDFLEFDLFTAQNAETEKRYREILLQRRSLRSSELFAENDVGILSAKEQIRTRAAHLGLFKAHSDSQVYYRPVQENESQSLNPIIVCAAMLLLCFIGFVFSRFLYKRKKRHSK